MTRQSTPVARRKYFTVEEANRMLPLVRSIVQDIVQVAREVLETRQRLEQIRRGRPGTSTQAHEEELIEMERAMERDAARVEEYIDELQQLGVEFKGFEGLVDFPAWMNGREVYLCWKLGEPEVAHWHELDAGFAGRQPLPPSRVEATPDRPASGASAPNPATEQKAPSGRPQPEKT